MKRSPAQPTPGPFFVEDEIFVASAHGQTICRCHDSSDFPCLEGGAESHMDEEAEANAELIARALNACTGQPSEASPSGPLGEITGEIYVLLEAARKAGDDRLLAFTHWMHERICLTRYQLRGEPWPVDRIIPPTPTPQAHAQPLFDRLIDRQQLLAKLTRERDEYVNENFVTDPETGTIESSQAKEEYLGTLEEQIEMIEQFPAAFKNGGAA